jgi:hypothetical protein
MLHDWMFRVTLLTIALCLLSAYDTVQSMNQTQIRRITTWIVRFIAIAAGDLLHR